MVAAQDQSSTSFRSSVILTTILGMIVLVAYVWALFTAQITPLNALGIAGFCLLLLCPTFVAYQTVRLTLQMGTGVSVRDSVRASSRRVTRLLLIDALVAVPLVVLFGLYLEIALAGIFSGISVCEGACPPNIVPVNTFIPQAITVLIIAVGLWGLNVLACILGAWLALHWQRALPAISGTILALVVTVAVIYALLNLTDLPQVPVDLVVALLPFVLTALAWFWLAVRTA